MKTALIYTIIGLLAINSLTAQVKIGDNPQNLNPASLLELESTSRALVISRVTDAQMSAISPLRGALVYNTDQNCLHYYDGTAWVNICEALDDSFTVSTRDDYMSQLYSNTLDSTVVITTTDNGDGSTNYNFEVGEITGSNIQNFSIEGRDIANGTIRGEKIAISSVDPLRIFSDGDDLTRQIILWNGNAGAEGEWQLILESDLQISEADGVIGNEVVDVTDGTLTRSGNGDAGDPYTLGVSPLGITENELANNAVTSNKILNSTILEEDIANDAVTLDKIANGTTSGQLMRWNGTDWVLVDETLLNITETDGIVGNEVTDATLNGSLALNGTGTQADPLTLDVLDGGIDTDELADGAVTTNKILDANVTRAKLEDGTTNGQLMQWDGTNWILIDTPTVSEGDGITVTPSGQDFNVAVTNPVVALGRVNNNATIVNASGVALPAAGSGVTRTSTGNYSVQFATPRPAGDVNYIVQLTVLNQPQPGTTIEVSNPTVNGFDVTIYAPFPMADFYETQDPTTPTTVDPHTHSVVVDNILYSPVDSSWYFTVTNL